MALFTVEVEGRPILVFSEEDREAAEDLLTSTIGPDLMDFEEEGTPVWDGQGALSVREADAAETAQWEAGFASSHSPSDTEAPEEEGYAVFLIEVDQPEDEDEDEEEEED